MTISFACPSCRKGYTVDAALAGRAGRCKACGRAFSVPDVEDDEYDDAVADDGYGLAEPIRVETPAELANVFSPGRDAPHVERPQRPRRDRRERPRASRYEPEDAFFVRHRKTLVVTAVVLAVGLGLTALLAPGGRLIVASILATVGGLMVVVGYLVGLWAAWREDSLYGFLYALIPLYSAYYIVTRWDDMWPWFLAMSAGAMLVVLAGSMVDLEGRGGGVEVGMDRPGFVSRASA